MFSCFRSCIFLRNHEVDGAWCLSLNSIYWWGPEYVELFLQLPPPTPVNIIGIIFIETQSQLNLDQRREAICSGRQIPTLQTKMLPLFPMVGIRTRQHWYLSSTLYGVWFQKTVIWISHGSTRVLQKVSALYFFKNHYLCYRHENNVTFQYNLPSSRYI